MSLSLEHRLGWLLLMLSVVAILVGLRWVRLRWREAITATVVIGAVFLGLFKLADRLELLAVNSTYFSAVYIGHSPVDLALWIGAVGLLQIMLFESMRLLNRMVFHPTAIIWFCLLTAVFLSYYYQGRLVSGLVFGMAAIVFALNMVGRNSPGMKEYTMGLVLWVIGSALFMLVMASFIDPENLMWHNQAESSGRLLFGLRLEDMYLSLAWYAMTVSLYKRTLPKKRRSAFDS